jgi:predicted nucleotidyltransferase
MVDIRDVIITKLQEWARGLAEKGHIDRAYVFGSLIYDGGLQFTPESSDVDLILRIPPSSRDPLQRLGILDALAEATLELEIALFQALPGRAGTKPITSITPVTEFELRFGVHKGGKPDLYSASVFLDLLKDSDSFVSLTRASHLKYEEHTAGAAGLEGTQKFRNQYVAVAPNSSRSVSEWNGDKDGGSQLALPKDMARAAGQLRHYRERLDDKSRFDVNRGIDTLHDLVRERERDNEEYKDLLRWLGPRRGGSGMKSPLNPRHQMLLWEVLAVAAEKALAEAEGGPALEPGDRITQPKLASAPSPALAQLSQPDAVVFARVIKSITTALELDRWSWFIDHAVRELGACRSTPP